MLLILVPVVSIIYEIIMNVNNISKMAGEIGILMISAYTLSNALVTVIFVTPYRRFTWNLVSLGPLRRRCLLQQATANINQPQRGNENACVREENDNPPENSPMPPLQRRMTEDIRMVPGVAPHHGGGRRTPAAAPGGQLPHNRGRLGQYRQAVTVNSRRASVQVWPMAAMVSGESMWPSDSEWSRKIDG
jgi:hypothetical protein